MTTAAETQISAVISRDTKGLLEQWSRATGQKKGFVVEAALRHHFQALRELPQDILIPPRVVIPGARAAALVRRLEARPKPRAALRRLMAAGGD